MRTLFTITGISENKLAFEQWMTVLGITYVNRQVVTADAVVPHFIVDTKDYSDIDHVGHWVDPDARRWEITACNKQYVREWIGDDRRYLGSMCEVDSDVANEHTAEHDYHWSLRDPQSAVYWIPQFRNPNTMRHFVSEPMKVLGTVTGRWPRDPRCPIIMYET